ILPVDVNASTTDMRLEWVSKTPDTPQGKRGIRLAFTTVLGLTKHEMRRLEREQTFDTLADLRYRARLSKKSLERLAQLAALDSMLAGTTVSRTDVVHHLEFLHSTTKRDRAGRAIPTGKTQAAGKQTHPLGAID